MVGFIVFIQVGFFKKTRVGFFWLFFLQQSCSKVKPAKNRSKKLNICENSAAKISKILNILFGKLK